METRRAFGEQIAEIRIEVVAAAGRLSEQVARATRALLDQNLELVDDVYAEHERLVAELRDIEQRTYSVVALQQPIAGDLRILLAVLRVVHELELTAGLMRNVARATRRLYPRALAPRVRGIVERMGSQASAQLRLAIDAFADIDIARASALPDMDDAMDELQKDLFRAIFAEGAPDESALQLAVQVSFVGRDYERAADHAVTIGNWVIFIQSGQLPGTDGESARS
jgi:phosphate transport system protein